jgi:hypothetical protein
MSVPIDPEQWYAAYEAAPASQQYGMLLDIIDQPLSLELAEELDLGMTLVEMQDALMSHNLFDQAIALIRTLQTKQPELHQREFPFLDNLLVKYYLYHNQPDQVRAALSQFMAHPAEDIDQTLAVLDYLKFYDAADLAVELCRTAYSAVEASPNVVPGTEMELGSVILNAQIQQANQQVQAGQSVDWDTFLAEAVQYGFDDRKEWVDEIKHDLMTTIEAAPEFFAGFKRDRGRALRLLSSQFCQTMAEKRMSFICSSAIWEAVVDFLESRRLPRKQLAHPNSYFAVSPIELDDYATHKIGGMLSLQQAVGVALLWGIPYVYDFLAARSIIRQEVQQGAIAAAQTLKEQLVDNFPQLWRYDFVHRWAPPDSGSSAEAELEARQFAASLATVTPLSNETGIHTTAALLDDFAQQLPPDLLRSLGDGDLEFEQDDEDWMNAGLSDRPGLSDLPEQPPLKPIKPAKPRKSPLQLAAELSSNGRLKPGSKPSGLSKKKKKRQGDRG